MDLQYSFQEGGDLLTIQLVSGIYVDESKLSQIAGVSAIAPLTISTDNGVPSLHYRVAGYQPLSQWLDSRYLSTQEFLAMELGLTEAGIDAEKTGVSLQLAEALPLVFFSGTKGCFLYMPLYGYCGQGLRDVLLEGLFSASFAADIQSQYVQEVMSYLQTENTFSLMGFRETLLHLLHQLEEENNSYQKQVEEEARLRAEEEARLRAEEEARLRAEEEARLRAEEEARLRAEEEARLRAEEEARLRAEEEARLRAEEEARLRAEEEARLRAEEEARLRAEEEARLREEEEARLRAEEEARLRAVPRLYFPRTGEQFSLLDPITRIGQKETVVDFCIPDNNTVSRHHADIIKRGDEYVLIDQGSLNKTYLNGQEVPPGIEVCLISGDRIVLSNETLYFQW